MAGLFPFQREAVAQLMAGKRIIISNTGSGKSAMAMVFAEQKCKETGKHKVLVVTTASKTKARTADGLNDFEDEAQKFCSSSFSKSLSSSLSLISWHKLASWTVEHWSEIENYVIVWDECLTANTKVKTQGGEKEIADLSIGDKVLSYNHGTHKLEYKKITRTIKKPSPDKMIRLRLANGTAIISTSNHPHFTQDGYKNAEDIKKGDTLYEVRTICKTESSERTSGKIWEVCKMWNLWDKYRRSDNYKTSKGQAEIRKSAILFNGMWKGGSKREWKKGDGEQRTERAFEKDGEKTNGYEQPVTEQRNDGQSTCYKERTRLATDMGIATRFKGRQRKIYRATETIVEKAEREGRGLGNGATSFIDLETARLSKQLQAGHWECLLQNRNRMRRGQPQFSQNKSTGQKEGKEIRGVRVESVEVLKLGDIKRLGLYRDADNVYCIDVEYNHNFFANGILTHNCQKAAAGASSKMGRAFLKITKRNQDWAGFTGTPGDTYLKLYPYFVATNLVRNKTSFLAEYANIQTFKGYPEIVGWRNEPKLKAMWKQISYAPDANKVLSELPEQTHKVFTFSKPKVYSTVLKTRMRAGSNGDSLDDFLDTPGALCSELRRLCFTKDKQEWVKDFVESAGANCIMFYNFIATGDRLTEICEKAIGENGRVWRIDGKHHEIPTAESVGPRDIILCQWQSGSEGLNVQFAHLWVSVEACYSYSTSIQARGRIRRIGQKHPQHYYYLKTDGTIEDAIYECLHNKSDFAESVWCLGKGIELKGGEE